MFFCVKQLKINKQNILFVFNISDIITRHECGAVAHLEERIVRNDEVAGSIPVCSTIFLFIFH